MATAQDIINLSYGTLGIESGAITTAQSTTALSTLNNMLGTWGIDGLLVPYRTLEYFSLVAGQSSYTIGASGNFNTVRPLEIFEAYIRDSSGIDYTLNPMSQAQYVWIPNKAADGRPTRFYYDPQYSLGKIYFDSEPTAVETLYLISEKAITEIATLATTVALPDFYKEALVYNLGVRIGIDSATPIPKYLAEIAATSKNTIENYIAKDKQMRPARLDTMLTYRDNRTSNIITGS